MRRLSSAPRRCRQLSSNVRQRNSRMWLPIRISACRRELNSHKAAEPQDESHLPQLSATAAHQADARGPAKCRTRFTGSTAASTNYLQPSNLTGRAHIASSKGFQSVGGAAELSNSAVAHAYVRRRQEHVAAHGRQRGARCFCGASLGTTGPWQARRRPASVAALPNTSLKLSTNGGPRGPGRRYVVHFRQPGPRVPPLAPA